MRTLPFSLSSLSVLFSIFVEEKIFLFHKIKRGKSLLIRKTKEEMCSQDPRKPPLTLPGALALAGKSRQEISAEPAYGVWERAGGEQIFDELKWGEETITKG